MQRCIEEFLAGPTIFAENLIVFEMMPSAKQLVLDSVLKYIVQSAKKQDWIKKIILFGSRARTDSTERSDYDFAVETDINNSWAEWVLNIRENVPTLCGIDLIKLDSELASDLQQAINKEGKIIYERKTKKK